MKPWYSVTFNIIISHIFPENVIEIPHNDQKSSALLGLQLEKSAYADLQIYLQISWHGISWKLTFRTPHNKMWFMNGIVNMVTWRSWKNCLVCNSLFEALTSTESTKLKFGGNKFRKKTTYNLEVINFVKWQRIIYRSECIFRKYFHLAKSIFNANFTFISCAEVCKQYQINF